MIVTLETLILLLLVIAMAAVVARRIRVPPAISLVLAGLALAVIPGLPSLELAPELVLFVILPPVLYWSAVTMSWREFRANLQPISLLAIGCVTFTHEDVIRHDLVAKIVSAYNKAAPPVPAPGKSK